MATIDELVVKLRADAADFQKNFQDAIRLVDRLKARFAPAGRELAGFFKNAAAETKALTGAFGQAFRGANSATQGMSFLGTSVGALLNPVTLATSALLAMSAGMIKVSTDSLKLASDLEASKNQMASLINLTTKFVDETGKPLNFADNFKASLAQAEGLVEQFRLDAPGLVNVETTDLIQTAQIGLSDLGRAGISDFKQQARVIEDVTTAVQQLGAAGSEVQLRTEVRQFLSGDFGNATSRLGQVVAAANGGTAALKAQYAEAIRTGKAYEFFTKILSDFRVAAELSAGSLSNQISVLKEGYARLATDAGNIALGSAKNFVATLAAEFQTPEIQQAFQSLGLGMSSAIQALIPYIPLIVQGLAEIMVSISGLVGILSPAIGFIGELIVKFQELPPGISLTVEAIGLLGLAFAGQFGTVIAIAIKLLGDWGAAVQRAPSKVKELADSFTQGSEVIKKNLIEAGDTAEEAEARIDEMTDGASTAFRKLAENAELSTSDITSILTSGSLSWVDRFNLATGAIFADWDNFWTMVAQTTLQSVAQIKMQIASLILAAEKAGNFVIKAFNKINSAVSGGAAIPMPEISFGGKKLLSDSLTQYARAGQKASDAFQRSFNKNLKASAKKSTGVGSIPSSIGGGGGAASPSGGGKSKGGKEAEKARKKGEKEAEKARQEAQRQESLKSERDAQLDLLNIEKQKIDQQAGFDTSIKENEALIKQLENENKIIEARKQRGSIDKQEAESLLRANNLRIQEAQQANSILEIEKQINAEKFKAEQAQANLLQKIKEANIDLAHGKITEFERAQLIEIAKQEYANVNTEINNAIESLGLAKENQEKWNASTGELSSELDSFEAETDSLTQNLEQSFQQLGQGIANIFQDGKVTLQEFGQLALNIIGNIAQQLINIGISSLFGGLGFSSGGVVPGFASGGIVPQYLASGGFAARGTDTVPAMLTPGEMVLNSTQQGYLWKALDSGNFSRFTGGSQVDNMNGNAKVVNNNNFHIQAVDSQSMIEAMSRKPVRDFMADHANQTVQRSSNKAFNKSPFEFQRGR